MNFLIKEWRIFKQDFKRMSKASFMFRFNWYVLKPLLLIFCILIFIFL